MTQQHQLRMAYAYPEKLDRVELSGGREMFVRAKQHPVRPARSTDASTWWEDVSPMIANAGHANGHQLRTITQ